GRLPTEGRCEQKPGEERQILDGKNERQPDVKEEHRQHIDLCHQLRKRKVSCLEQKHDGGGSEDKLHQQGGEQGDGRNDQRRNHQLDDYRFGFAEGQGLPKQDRAILAVVEKGRKQIKNRDDQGQQLEGNGDAVQCRLDNANELASPQHPIQILRCSNDFAAGKIDALGGFVTAHPLSSGKLHDLVQVPAEVIHPQAQTEEHEQDGGSGYAERRPQYAALVLPQLAFEEE